MMRRLQIARGSSLRVVDWTMTPARLHDDQIEIDIHLVRRLVDIQFPQWSDALLTPVESSGTVNALYRLGGDLVVRLPLAMWGAEAAEREQEWLPRLSPLLPVEIPRLLGRGQPDLGYPCPWSVFGWIEGSHPQPDGLPTSDGLADDLASLIRALHEIDLPDAPGAYRGPVSEVDGSVRRCIAEVADEFDTGELTRAWEVSVLAPEWEGPPLWAHSDLLASNLLIRDGRLAAVIDFGTAGVGDPACDLMVAWNVLPAPARPSFRAAVGLDDPTWLRGRGWALAQAVIALPYYRETNPGMTRAARHAISQVLADVRDGDHLS
jgi:aminoglycoside phosphotransferase (APT) family kinase protein